MGVVTAVESGTIDVGDLTVNRLGFGAMRVTGPGIWGEPSDRQAAKEILRRAVELDVNFIDTADSYGPAVSETLIAEALHPYPADLVIATKAGLERPGPGQWTPNGHPDHLRAACDGSLARLKLEQIAVYQLHRPDPAVPLEDSIGTLVELRDQGKIRHIGVSNVTRDQLAAAQAITPIVSVQNRYNVVDRRSDGVLDACEQAHVVFLPWAPIQDADGIDVVREAARRRGVSVQHVVLAWLLHRSTAMLPIPGTASMTHLEDNVAAAGIRLDPEEVDTITAVAGS